MFDLDIELDPLTNRVCLGEHYNLCFVFLANPSSSFAEFVSGIHQGLERLSKQFPRITGQVKHDGYTKQEGNKYRIIPSFIDEDFPMAWINGNHVPIHKSSLDSRPFPVMELKFTIEKGASVLTISGHSKVFDMTGLCMIIRMLAKACRQEKFTSLEISGMENHAAFFHNDNKMQRHDRIPVRFVPDLLLPQTTSFQERNIKWTVFSFDQDAPQDIKDMSMSSDSPSQYLPNWFVWCIRIPWHLPASEGLVYFMPRSAQNEIAVAVSLRQTDLEKLLGSAQELYFLRQGWLE
ncbi:hypothetical protein DER46DRAFT_621759 [Fusarium sp. MPI-SDFR-AT-0072]|nr:hypothetical protein DER46DRAFT_621759 [Fusarium sp. MPI-SDFR-AT-0072]